MIRKSGWLQPGLAIMAAMLLVSPASADFRSTLLKPGTIVVGTTGSAPPTTMIDASGKLAGYDIDLMEKVAAELGVKVDFVQLDWAGLLPGLAAHRFDVVASGVSRTPERLKSSDFIMLSATIVNGVAITKLASNTTINGWGDVCGKRMGGVRGANEPKLVLQSLPAGCVKSVTDYPGWTELALDLKNGRIDFIGMDDLGPAYEAAHDKALAVLPEVRLPTTQSLAVSGAEPELAKAIDLVLTKYRNDGTLNTMIEHWFGQRVDFKAVLPEAQP